MYPLTKIRIFIIVVILASTSINPAFGILSENIPKKYNLTPIENSSIEKEQPTTNISAPLSTNESAGTGARTSNNDAENESDKIPKPTEVNNKITITFQRIDPKNTMVGAETPLLSKTLSDLRNSLNQNSFYQFVPSTPENNFIILSALDIIVSDTQNSLSSLLVEPKSVDAEPNCRTDLETCNTQLLSSISTRLEQLEFLNNSKQALGEPTSIPEIRLELQPALTENEIALAFLAPDVKEQSMENSYMSPSGLSYAIRNILKNKKSIFAGSETGFKDNLKILQSQLKLTSQLDSNHLIDILKTDTNAKDSNLSIETTQKTIKQIDDFVEFVNAEKIVINDNIITNDMATDLLPSQLANTLEQESSAITSLYDLIGYYISEDDQKLQKNEVLKLQILLWFENYNNFIDSMKSLKFLDDKMSDVNLRLLSTLQDNLRNTQENGIKVSDNILNSSDGLQIFSDVLPELSQLNQQMKDTQNKIPFKDFDLIMSETTDSLNQILITLSNQNIDNLKQPVNEKTLNYFSDLVPENRAMKGIMSYILSEDLGTINAFNTGLSGAGLRSNNNGFFDYQSGYLKLNSDAPKKKASLILDNFNYISEIY